MIQLDLIRNYFPPEIRNEASFQKHLLKEYLQLLILDYLSATPYSGKIVFIGGTSLRLVKGIDRFSEDLDFDCKGLSGEEFMAMTDDVLQFLLRNGLRTEIRDRENKRLKAFRRSFYFPELLFETGLSGHKDERFLIKMESQDQQYSYQPVQSNIRGCGFFFPFPVPSDQVLCSMKISAMLSRHKGRDFYDAMFLLARTGPDYGYLSAKHGIKNPEELKFAVAELLKKVDLKLKRKDFEHLLFQKRRSERILTFEEFIQEVL